jgi:hypothetical protein
MTREEDFEITPKTGSPYTVRVYVDFERLAKLLAPRAKKSKAGRSSIARAGVVVVVRP